MTEALLQKLEEKMMCLLSEVEDLRKDVVRLHHENSHLKYEKEHHTKKVTDLISLLDAVTAVDNAAASVSASHVSPIAVKPVLIQGLSSVERAEQDYAQST